MCTELCYGNSINIRRIFSKWRGRQKKKEKKNENYISNWSSVTISNYRGRQKCDKIIFQSTFHGRIIVVSYALHCVHFFQRNEFDNFTFLLFNFDFLFSFRRNEGRKENNQFVWIQVNECVLHWEGVATKKIYKSQLYINKYARKKKLWIQHMQRRCHNVGFYLELGTMNVKSMEKNAKFQSKKYLFAI